MDYQAIKAAFRKEKASATLVKLEEDFYAKALEVLERLEDEMLRRNLRKVLENLYWLRVGKILKAALAPGYGKPEELLECEVGLYTALRDLLNSHRASVFEKGEKKQQDTSEEEKHKPKLVRVRMLSPLPAIVGSDSKGYGPFERDQIVELPQKTAEILIKREVAERV